MGKIKLNKEGLQGLFVSHVEKIVLGAVLMLLGLFVYTGYSLEGLPSDQRPDKLVAIAKQAKTNVTNPENWKNIYAHLVIPTGHENRAKQSQNPTDAEAYHLDKPLEPKNYQIGQRRQDPTLFAPEKVEVMTITGPVAHFLKRGEKDLLAEAKNFAHEKPKPKKFKSTRKRFAEGEMESGFYGGESDADSGDYPGMSLGSAGYGMAGSGGSMAGMPGLGGMPGEAGIGLGMEAAIMANPLDRTGFQAGMGAVAKSLTAVVVKAVVPWKKQWEEFDQEFSNALGYNPARDAPRYLSFTAERAEVTDDPNAPLVWEKKIWTLASIKALYSSGYFGVAQEVADPRYLVPGVLTMPVPPFINRDLERLALHSEVPRLQMQLQAVLPEDGNTDTKGQEKEKEKDLGNDSPADFPGATGIGVGIPPGAGMPGDGGMPGMSMPGGMPGMPGGMPGMPGGMPGMQGGMPGMPGMSGGYPGMPGMEGAGMPGMSGFQGSDVSGMAGMSGYSGYEGGAGYGMPGDYGMPGFEGEMGMPGMSAMVRGPQVPYLLIRFFDFDVEVGKKYRYRVQVLLEDPNHPQSPQWDLSERYLDESVKKRLAPLIAEEKQKKSRLATTFLRTAFSEPSEIVSVQVEDQAYAGKIAAGRWSTFKDTKDTRDTGFEIPIQMDEPSGKIMAVVWDAEHAVDVPGILDAFRGTFLSFKSKADVIHPVSLIFKRLDDFDFQTSRLIADIRGGQELPGGEKLHPLLSLGEYAFFDATGQLHVRNELDDWEYYRKLVPPEPTTTQGYGGSEGGEDGGMMPGMPGMPGDMPGAPGVGGPGDAGGRRGNRGRGNTGS